MIYTCSIKLFSVTVIFCILIALLHYLFNPIIERTTFEKALKNNDTDKMISYISTNIKETEKHKNIISAIEVICKNKTKNGLLQLEYEFTNSTYYDDEVDYEILKNFNKNNIKFSTIDEAALIEIYINDTGDLGVYWDEKDDLYLKEILGMLDKYDRESVLNCITNKIAGQYHLIENESNGILTDAMDSTLSMGERINLEATGQFYSTTKLEEEVDKLLKLGKLISYFFNHVDLLEQSAYNSKSKVWVEQIIKPYQNISEIKTALYNIEKNIKEKNKLEIEYNKINKEFESIFYSGDLDRAQKYADDHAEEAENYEKLIEDYNIQINKSNSKIIENGNKFEELLKNSDLAIEEISEQILYFMRSDEQITTENTTENTFVKRIIEYANNPGLKYNPDLEDLYLNEIQTSIIVDNNERYEFEGEFYSYREEIIDSIARFNYEWIEYVNNGEDYVLELVLKDSQASKNIVNFNRGDVKEKYLLLEIGEVRTNGETYYVWAHEKIKKEKKGAIEIKEYYWIYKLIQKEMDYYVVDYIKDPNKY
ncbi:hypothetical protein SAMN05660462_00535 [Proteiniborus ethanoligenes]|uniref:Uncharacterized protein n=1 Tax=Proteiniborus ethanoligenes TaxID=415015 RepID=A0A1H3LGF1_9FIRM|nr:hypothetical protein [Proteiniborus ethanoligenes]SDY63522.1 hypothetical protein SAMN05660462_00535 [Proteiniborus ethanoligenes]